VVDRCIRRDVRVEGVVQGVGFRPFVHGLATQLRLAGRVGNDVHGVFVEVEGPQAEVEQFLDRLRRQAPPLAEIERLSVLEVPPRGATGFTIVASQSAGPRTALVSADATTCEDCLRELFDPADRRYGYPFINCTNCGPRFTIIRDVPYDRPLTTMAGFTMCPDCAAEYHDPTNRRFHAQPVCCPTCGPRLRLAHSQDPLAAAVECLLAGQVLAVKGLGGYHLSVLAGDESAAAALRSRKRREDKPFAVMAADLDQAGALCELDETGAALLTSRRRPIVLLPRRAGAAVAPSVAPGNRHLGVMLPYTPVHHLLLRAVGEPVVMTSGNVSDEPIAYLDAAALVGIADQVLTHDRPIHIRTDDSVVRPSRGHGSVLRRSRGYVPEPVTLALGCPRPILACGAELKNTFCVAKHHHAFVSHHIGDLENYETLRSFTDGIEHFQRLFDIAPEVVAHDLHPEYLSTKYALGREGVQLLGVQHHHAHIASCLADNRVAGPVLGVAFDGTGYGLDGTIWGGEFLLADLAGFRRVGHLTPVAMPGGTAAIKHPWRMTAAYLGAHADERLEVVRRNAEHWPMVVAIGQRGVNSPLTSSAGRLFDAVAALLGVRDSITYEGQAAIELEQLAEKSEKDSYPVAVEGEAVVDGADLVHAAMEDLMAGVATPVISARFHNAVADAITGCCLRLRESTGVHTVALSGGVFQNVLLLGRTVDRLESNGMRVLTHSRVPTNDGGVSLGQIAVAAARDRDLTPDGPP